MGSQRASSKDRIEVAAGLVFRDHKLLITQRPLGSHLAGMWEFPGGKREAAETFEACLERELAEELGIVVRVEQLVETIAHDYPEKSVLLQFYRCRWMNNEPRAIGCADYRWISREEISQFQFPPADTRLLESLAENSALWE